MVEGEPAVQQSEAPVPSEKPAEAAPEPKRESSGEDYIATIKALQDELARERAKVTEKETQLGDYEKRIIEKDDVIDNQRKLLLHNSQAEIDGYKKFRETHENMFKTGVYATLRGMKVPKEHLEEAYQMCLKRMPQWPPMYTDDE